MKWFSKVFFLLTVSTDGKIQYSEVRTFMEKQLAVATTFLSVTTSENKTIDVTGNHFLYARKIFTDSFIPILRKYWHF